MQLSARALDLEQQAQLFAGTADSPRVTGRITIALPDEDVAD